VGALVAKVQEKPGLETRIRQRALDAAAFGQANRLVEASARCRRLDVEYTPDFVEGFRSLGTELPGMGRGGANKSQGLAMPGPTTITTPALRSCCLMPSR
jgi:hypothetical protein